jgi:hypothetical protein
VEEFGELMERVDVAAYRLDKLNKIKCDKIRNYKQINQRLINDHKRLISQLNELKRYSCFLSKK